MAEYTIPAPDAPAHLWGQLAASIPGFQWRPGMLDGGSRARCVSVLDGSVAWSLDDWLSGWCEPDGGEWPDPDDPATEGCLVRSLGATIDAIYPVYSYGRDPCGYRVMGVGDYDIYGGSTLGRAAIRAAAVIGEWPGGVE